MSQERKYHWPMHCLKSAHAQGTHAVEKLNVSVHELQLHLNESPTRIDQIKEETSKDEVLPSLRAVITQGWPDTRSECPPHLHAYWNY